jgi:hypothetical protein
MSKTRTMKKVSLADLRVRAGGAIEPDEHYSI